MPLDFSRKAEGSVSQAHSCVETIDEVTGLDDNGMKALH